MEETKPVHEIILRMATCSGSRLPENFLAMRNWASQTGTNSGRLCETDVTD